MFFAAPSVQLDENFTVSDPKNLFPDLKNKQLRKSPHNKEYEKGQTEK
jgi:hypothetical protein